jgi:hypothetical protein
VTILRRRRAHSVLRQIPPGAVLADPFRQCAQSNRVEHLLRLGRTWSPASSMFVSV